MAQSKVWASALAAVIHMMRSMWSRPRFQVNAPLMMVKIAVSAPMPRASATTATTVKPGVEASERMAYRMSLHQDSSEGNVHISCSASLVAVRLPKLRLA